MVDLSGVKVVIFDFDETLCIWGDRSQYMEGMPLWKGVMECGWEFWDEQGCVRNEFMPKFLKSCIRQGVELGLMSCAQAIVAQAMSEWCFQKYGKKFENYCVGTTSAKLDMLKAIAECRQIPRDSILLVDDLAATLRAAAREGFRVASPLDIAGYKEKRV